MGHCCLIQIGRRMGGVVLLWTAVLAAVVCPKVALGQDVRWSYNYGGGLNEDGYAACPSGDGGFFVLGSTFSYGAGDHDLYLLRLDSLGDTLWTRTYGGPAADYGYDIRPADSGTFVMVGATYSFGAGSSDMYVIKINSSGDTLWTHTYGGSDREIAWSVQTLSGGGCIVAGKTRSYGAGSDDVYLVRIDSHGDTVWTRTYGGASGETAYAIRATGGGDFVVTGSTGSFGEGYSSVYALRVTGGGDTLWTRTYGGAAADIGYAGEPTLDGGFVFAGATWSFGVGQADMYLVKTDANGSVLWQRNYGGSEEDRAQTVRVLPDGGFLLCGTTLSYGFGQFDMYVVKIDLMGEYVWDHAYGGTKADYCRGAVADGSDFCLIGYTYSWSEGGSDVWMVKISGEQTTGVNELDSPGLPETFALAQNYPNPFNGATVIEFELASRASVSLMIYNILGQVVRTVLADELPAGYYSVDWDSRDDAGREVASGVYLYSLSTPHERKSRKMILLK